MLHLFCADAGKEKEILEITGSDVNHIRNVMRLKPGDEISVSNGFDGREYRYGIESEEETRVVCRLRFVKEADTELPVKVYLFQGLPKADKMDLIVQKAVELGVYSVIPVSMARCVVKLDKAKGAKKASRWQAIAQSAAQQSRRTYVPEVTEPMTMQEALAFAREKTDHIILPYELQECDSSTNLVLDAIRPGESISVFIGPEGGFEPSEADAALEAGAKKISLGRRILRTETAGLAFLSWMIYLMEIREQKE